MTGALDRTRAALDAVAGVNLTDPRAIHGFGRLFASEMEFDLGVMAVPDEQVWRGSGVPIRIDQSQVWTWRGEELVRIRVFADRASALEAVEAPAS